MATTNQARRSPKEFGNPFWPQGVQFSTAGVYECIEAFSETDFTEDLKKFDVPTLVLHGDADQIVPIDISAKHSSKIIPNATLKIIPGAPHRIATTHADQINGILLEFLEQTGKRSASSGSAA